MTVSDFARIARRPRWIGALLLALAIAAIFAALGQWQVGRSVQNAQAPTIDTETPVALTSIATPQTTMTDPEVGRRVSIDGTLSATDFAVLTGRINDGRTGAWLVGHLVTPDGDSLVVALGWAPDPAAAEAAEGSIPTGEQQWSGRYLSSEAPQDSDFEHGVRSTLSVAELINIWPDDPGPVYAGYLTAGTATPGLITIESPAPTRDLSLNWLNLFYAAEWVIFAGFAIYLWYRLVRDAWEREQEEAAAEATVE